MARKQYKCGQCKTMHFAGSKVGRKHRKHEVKVKRKKAKITVRQRKRR